MFVKLQEKQRQWQENASNEDASNEENASNEQNASNEDGDEAAETESEQTEKRKPFLRADDEDTTGDGGISDNREKLRAQT